MGFNSAFKGFKHLCYAVRHLCYAVRHLILVGLISVTTFEKQCKLKKKSCGFTIFNFFLFLSSLLIPAFSLASCSQTPSIILSVQLASFYTYKYTCLRFFYSQVPCVRTKIVSALLKYQACLCTKIIRK